jgi:hypothetical protein
VLGRAAALLRPLRPPLLSFELPVNLFTASFLRSDSCILGSIRFGFYFSSRDQAPQGRIKLISNQNRGFDSTNPPMPHGKSGPSALGAGAMPGGPSSGDGEVEPGFAKLQGEDFEYYMQTYSIMLGRNSKKSTVDVDLSSLGGGMNISRHHARIFYDFQRRRFALDVIGKNGCLVEGVLHLPGNPPVKLDSQDLLQIGDKKFYFLLPSRSIFASAAAARARHAPIIPPQLPPPSYTRPGRPRLSDFHDRSSEGDYGREVDEIGNGLSEIGASGKLIKRNKNSSGDLDLYGGHRINVEAIGTLAEGDN